MAVKRTGATQTVVGAAVVLVFGLLVVRHELAQFSLRKSLSTDVAGSARMKAGQEVRIPRALVGFAPMVPAPEFDARTKGRGRNHRFVLIRDQPDGPVLPMVYWRTTFLDSNTIGDFMVAEVGGTLRRASPAQTKLLRETFPELASSAQLVFLEEAAYDPMPVSGVVLGLLAMAAVGLAVVLLAGAWRPRAKPAPVARPVRAGEPRTPRQESRRDCAACGLEMPAASRCCNSCRAPVEVEYYVSSSVPFDGFDRFVPILARALGASEYQSRQALARVHSPLPFAHLESYSSRGQGSTAPYRLMGRGIDSLVKAQALAAALGEAGASAVVVGSDELLAGPFPQAATALHPGDDAVTLVLDDNGEALERTIPWSRVALVLFSADVPIRGTMTIANEVRENAPKDVTSYLIDLYEHGQDTGIRIAEDSFHRWEFLRLNGSQRPADRFGRLIELLEERCPDAEFHYVTGMYRGARLPWRMNFFSRLSFLVGEKSGWQRREGPPRLDGYEILEKVGEGAMGAVYRARQKKLGRSAAIKVVAPHLAGGKTFIQRFQQEARAVAQLSHPNIVQVMDLVERGGRYFMVMEFVEGTTLQRRIREQGRLPEIQALRIGLEVASAIQHASGRSIIHRDIKPDNIFLTHAGEVKLGDWGLAKDMECDLALTDTGTAVGTPYYMSPEQARARRDLDYRSDVYSLGATLYHALTGRPPFGGQSPTEVLMRHLNAEPTDPRRFTKDLSAETARLVLRMLAKSPDDRCTDCDQILAGFHQAIRAQAGTAAATR